MLLCSLVLAVILTAFALVMPVKSGDLPYRIGVLIGRFILYFFSIIGRLERKKHNDLRHPESLLLSANFQGVFCC
ncbi:hypothetical protein [Streptococcus mutans]|uniref:hypothetical protein n=1 Tax=Streptococcus mutans TaxID=1309 RepID=UPI0002B57F4B|nr:hypothetical protein [Streptococcus mutans]EMB60472.1 hypothetical protein SMU20_03515 [Streptococcus mutans 15JP3]MDB8638398.1 hypothetical protein [Streptococcus mutans]MDB8640061.1 hypothetical protein [Streptococcus mutans]